MNITNSVYKSKLLSWLYCRVSQLKYPNYKKEVERRALLDIFDYKEIAQPLPKCYYEPLTDNNCFGIGWSFRQYVGSNKSYINALAEHGYFFGPHIQEMEKITYSPKLITFGEIRKKHIETFIKDKDVFPVGPYIHYAPDYYDEVKFAELKKELGRTLLVFFSHSGTGMSVSFDLDELMEKINSIRQGFETIVISVFWSDLNPAIENRLLKEGYKIFSSGHRYDYYFLSRQKTMIKLADVTMSNSVGTHIAYCCYLNKPHWLINQTIERKANGSKGAENLAIAKKISNEGGKTEGDLFRDAFAKYSETLTESQKELCDKFFGFSYVKTVDELKDIIK